LAYMDGDVIYTKYYKPSRNKKISWEVRAIQDTGLGTWFLRNKCNRHSKPDLIVYKPSGKYMYQVKKSFLMPTLCINVFLYDSLGTSDISL